MRLTNDFGESRMREIRMSGLTREGARDGHWLCLSFRASLSTLLPDYFATPTIATPQGAVADFDAAQFFARF